MNNCKPVLHSIVLVFLAITCVIQTGCAEGPLWKTGQLSPFARDKWLAEEQIADTLFERKRSMNSMVESAKLGSPESRDEAAGQLHQIVRRDAILLMRLHAVKLLGELNSPVAIDALRDAANDPDAEVRIAAVKSWKKFPENIAVSELQGMIQGDTNTDVRLAATRALGSFSGESAVRALSYALTDNNPALQVRATESLERVTGESIGPNVAAWQNYVDKFSPAYAQTAEQPAAVQANENGSMFR